MKNSASIVLVFAIEESHWTFVGVKLVSLGFDCWQQTVNDIHKGVSKNDFKCLQVFPVFSYELKGLAVVLHEILNIFKQIVLENFFQNSHRTAAGVLFLWVRKYKD